VTPAATARGGALHPSLPQRPGFDLVPKEEAEAVGDAKAATAAGGAAAAAPSPPGKKLNKTERAAEAIKQGREQGLAALQGSNEDIVKNRRAIRMANLSAAEKLKAELEGRATIADGEKSGPETVVMQRTEDEEQVEMTREEAREVLEEQGEEGGVDEEIVPREIQPDSEDGEAEVDRPGSEPMEAETETEPPSRASRVDGTTEADGDVGDVEVVGETETQTEAERVEGKRGKKKGKRGKKRKYDEAEEDLTSSSESESEAPPDIEADQPVPKKKLKFNPDGTVEGYEDDVK
jgi:5'-3' exoribonuclease 2